jgi:Phage integrase, N-terminal SAM-like domain/Arm DNA-binding domain
MRGSIRKRGSTYTYWLDLPADPVTGKRRQKTKGGFRTKRECQAALNEAVMALQTGTYVEASRRTVRSFLLDEWLPDREPPKLRATTYANYQTQIRTHVLPALGSVELQRLSPAQLNGFYRALLAVMDGPMAVYGPPAKLRARALEYFQQMAATTPGAGPYLCGVEKTGIAVDYAATLARHNALQPGDLLVVDAEVLAAITNSGNPIAYGSETYWGRKFLYRSLDGRTVVITVLPASGPPYDDHGGQPEPAAYPSLPAVLDVIDRTGSAMYRNGIIPVALAHSKAAYPIGVGTDVLRLVARRKLGLDPTSPPPSVEGQRQG